MLISKIILREKIKLKRKIDDLIIEKILNERKN